MWTSKECQCHWRSSWRSHGRDVFYLHISIFSGKLVIQPSVLRGCPVQDGHIWTCPFGPSQFLLRPYTTEPYAATMSLESLAEVREANTNAGHQHFVPTLEFFTARLCFNFKHNLEKALQVPQKFYPKRK